MITKSEKIAELQAYLIELKNCKPRLLSTSVEEVDDIYQQMLEWQYEYSAVSDEIKLIETMEQNKFDNYYNPQEPENEEYHKPQYGDIICGDFCEDEY